MVILPLFEAINGIIFTNVVVIKSRYCLLIGYYIDSIYKDSASQKMFAGLIAYLVESVALKSPEFDVVAVQATEGLKAFVEEEDTKKRVTPFIGEIVEKFSTYVDFVPHIGFFDIFQEIIK